MAEKKSKVQSTLISRPAEMTSIRVLAVDPGNDLGWSFCYKTGRGRPVLHDWGVVRFPTKENLKEDVGKRWAMFNHWLLDQVHERKPTHLSFESGAFSKHAKALTNQAGYTSRIQECAFTQSLQWIAAPPPTIKKWATGYGFSKKREMIAAAEKLVRTHAVLTKRLDLSEHEADAICLGLFSIEFILSLGDR